MAAGAVAPPKLKADVAPGVPVVAVVCPKPEKIGFAAGCVEPNRPPVVYLITRKQNTKINIKETKGQ